MGKMRRLLGVLLSLLMIISLSFPSGATEFPDTYSIRIFAGKQGTMTSCVGGNGRISEDGKTFILDGLVYGGRVNIGLTEVTAQDGVPGVDDTQNGYNYFVMSIQDLSTGSTSKVTFQVEGKYYIMGNRESGKDNSERKASFQVENDTDYVVAYGLMKDSVEYTIHYLDTMGYPLRESEKYRGTVGDKPVVAYQYVDGYQPQAYNLTKTLVANAAENIFTFIYIPIPAPGTTVIVIPGQPAPPSPTQAPGEPPADTDTDTQPPVVVEEPTVPGPYYEEIPDDFVPTFLPGELEDMDEERIPQAGYKGDKDSGQKGFEEGGIISILNGNAFLVNIPLPVKILAVAVFVILAGGAIWWIVTCMNKKKEDARDETGAKDSTHSEKHPKEKG